ncbi:MAG: 2-oxo acid dehydrogenase subunit E2 [Oleiphilaceae bacterium]|nr:2-oxo acid dehydrogenase subunit E2 [Oleiphilaceae bacterium]
MSNFILPDIGEGIVECELVKWLAEEGDLIEEDEPVAEVMTDKALVELTAPYKGRITRLYYAEGETARVHEPLYELVAEGEESDRGVEGRSQTEGDASTSADSEKTVSGAEPGTPRPAADTPAGEQGKTKNDNPNKRIPATPAVRRLARENELDLANVPGSGKDGRVLKADVLSHLDQAEAGAAAPAGPTPAGSGRSPEGDVKPGVEAIKGVRAAMARHMTAAASVPHFIYSEDIDITDLLTLRAQLKPEAEARGSRLTLMPFFMKALALAVQEYPVINSRLNDEVTEIHYQPRCNIGMAVDSQSGLLVPNVKGVERLTLLEIAAEVARLTEACRAGRVTPEDLKGGTVTISNIGALGGTYAAPVINVPEVAIVALGRAQKLPRFDARGDVVARSIMTVSWAGDHRIIDGGTIARFCNCWKSYLEQPQTMLLHLG